jgi:hypothetical protein
MSVRSISQVHIPPLNHFSLWVSDLEAAVAHLTSKVLHLLLLNHGIHVVTTPPLHRGFDSPAKSTLARRATSPPSSIPRCGMQARDCAYLHEPFGLAAIFTARSLHLQ